MTNSGTLPLDSTLPLPLGQWPLLDWRYLLPSLRWDRIGYVAPVDGGGDIVAALRALDPDAVDLRALPSGSAPVSVAILHGPTVADVRAAHAAVRPDGWVCAFVYRGSRSDRATGSLMRCRRTFERAGLCDIDVFWHAPTIAESSRIVPLKSWSAVRDTLSRHHNVRFGGIVSRMAMAAHRLGLFRFVVPEGSVVGRVPALPASAGASS